MKTMKRQTIQTGVGAQVGRQTPWAVINHPTRTDYLLIDRDGFCHSSPSAQPGQPDTLRLTLPEAVRLLAGWFDGAGKPVIGLPAWGHHPAAVSIHGPRGRILDLADEGESGWAWLSYQPDQNLTPADIARVLHDWFGEHGR